MRSHEKCKCSYHVVTGTAYNSLGFQAAMEEWFKVRMYNIYQYDK